VTLAIAALLSALFGAARADKLPKPTEVACFPCHSTVTWASGPAFPHAVKAHRLQGHCHTCHQGAGHEGRRIDPKACTGCHEEGSKELAVLGERALASVAPDPAAPHRAATDKSCLLCHTAPLFDAVAFSRSVHKRLACGDCHKGYSFSLGRKGVKWDEAEQKLIDKLAGKSNAPEALAACGRCHEAARDDWSGSVHARFLTSKRPAGAGCLDCHGDPHAIGAGGKLTAAAARKAQSETCIGCHEDPALVKRAGLSEHPAPSYRDSVHGRMVALQNDRAPGCASCHGHHDIAAADAKASSVSSANKVQTCAECHKGADANFAALFTHQPLTRDTRKIPFWTTVAFSWLTSTVLTLLVLHLLMDLGAEVRHRLRRRKEPAHEPPRLSGSAPRFDRHQLAQHWLIIASVLTLVATELPVRAAGVPTSLSLANFFGGVRAAGLIHRVAGMVMGLAGLYHLVYLTVLGARRKLPFTMVPSKKDAEDLIGNVAFFLGARPERPRIGRYAYHEKFDYWAVFWGVAIMFGTGLMRWFPVFFARWLPASVIEAAQIAHGDEATLAALVLFVWHLYMVHLKPSVFPMQWTWIDGRIELELLREEHRAEFDALGTGKPEE
jgi:cytochrome b subunit of formate dehydrogenase